MTGNDKPQNWALIGAGLVLATVATATAWIHGGFGEAVWVSWVSLFAVFETHGIISETRGDTLSENLHNWFQLKTKAGRLGFFATIGMLFAWLSWHLVELRPI